MSAESTLLPIIPKIASFYIEYSTIIVTGSVASMSILFQNIKGCVYMGFLFAACILRYALFYYFIKDVSSTPPAETCKRLSYGMGGDNSFSSFIFAFTISYLSFPMFLHDIPNLWLFGTLVTYMVIDIIYKLRNCKPISMSHLILDILFGASMSLFFVGQMYLGGSGKYLFFNEVSESTDMCYKPDNQTFKCDVYKNGELLV